MVRTIVIDLNLEASTRGRLGAIHHVLAANRQADTAIRIMGSQNTTVDQIDGVEVEKLLNSTALREPTLEGRDAQRHVRNLAIAFRNSLAKALIDIGSRDTVHLLHADISALHGIAAWASSIPRGKLPAVVLHMMTPADEDALPRARSSPHAVAAVVDVLISVFSDRITIHAYDQSKTDGFPSAVAPEIESPTARLDDRLPTVDIIVTLHNYRRFLERCLQSVACQTYPAWRCVVVDDGSSDIEFGELRALVARFGRRFVAVRHEQPAGQLEAIATGLSLGSNPFVLMLDADDELTEQALEHHVSWHLNSVVPVAMTSGRMFLVDSNDRILAGSGDHLPWPEERAWRHPLPATAAWHRPETEFEPAPAVFIDQRQAPFGMWHWSPTSGLMLRRTAMELFLPERFDLGRLSGDTYFAITAHAFGGSLLIEAHVGRYRRHGGNGLAFPAIYGSGAMAVPPADPSWPGVARILRDHIEKNLEQVSRQVANDLIERFLGEAPLCPDAPDESATPLTTAVAALVRAGSMLRSTDGGSGPRPGSAIVESATFRAGGAGCQMLHVGWSRPESWGCWSVGPRAMLKWPLKTRPSADLRVSLRIRLFSSHRQSVAITVNGAKVANIAGRPGNTTSSFVVPAEVAATYSALQIGFEIAHPQSPKEVGSGDDVRKLGIGLEQISVEYRGDQSSVAASA